MSNNVTLPGTGVPVESIDIGSGVERQVVTVGDRGGNAVDVIGSLTETAPATDTASSGLNGRSQRIAQRLTTLIGLTPGPATSNSRLLSSAASTNGTNVKGSAGILLNVIGYNAVGTIAYLKLYNKATSPTVGTDTPTHTFVLPPYGVFNIPVNYSFATGIGFGLTTAAADNSTAAVASGDITCLNFQYI